MAARLASGTAARCPICQNGLRCFLPFGVGRKIRSNALCPFCRSLERDRFAWLQLSSSAEWLTPTTRLLHIAPERCLAPRLREILDRNYVTADLIRKDVDHQLSVERLPFAEHSFDAVICNHVLEHVVDDVAALSEIYRVLYPGGWALLQVPLGDGASVTIEDPSVTSPRERRRRFGQHDHRRLYGRDYPERLRRTGFDLELREACSMYPKHDIQRYGLDPTEVLHIVRRP